MKVWIVLRVSADRQEVAGVYENMAAAMAHVESGQIGAAQDGTAEFYRAEQWTVRGEFSCGAA